MREKEDETYVNVIDIQTLSYYLPYTMTLSRLIYGCCCFFGLTRKTDKVYQSAKHSIDPLTVKLVEQNANQRRSKM